MATGHKKHKIKGINATVQHKTPNVFKTSLVHAFKHNSRVKWSKYTACLFHLISIVSYMHTPY